MLLDVPEKLRTPTAIALSTFNRYQDGTKPIANQPLHLHTKVRAFILLSISKALDATEMLIQWLSTISTKGFKEWQCHDGESSPQLL